MDGGGIGRAAVEGALSRLSLTWADWPAAVVDRRLTPDERLAGLLLLLEETVVDSPPVLPEPPWSQGPLDLDDEEAMAMLDAHEEPWREWLLRERPPWDRLARFQLPWAPTTATLALDLVSDSDWFDAARTRPVLDGAAALCASGRADEAMVSALKRCRDHLEAVPSDRHQVRATRAAAQRALSLLAPPDLLDLSLVVDGDRWGPAARERARAAASDVAPLVRALGRLGSGKPSRSWLHEVEQASVGAAGQALLHDWLELAAAADVVPAPPGVSFDDVPATLYVGTNEDLVRAAVWATVVLREADWPAPLLGVLARRGAAHNGMDAMTEALSLRVASAAVEVLARRGGSADRRVLEELLDDLQRRDLVTRVGAALGRQQDAAERVEAIRVSKARATRAKAPLAPRKARGAMDALLRHELGPVLRSLGFRGGPRTWRREGRGRVELVVVQTRLDGVNLVSLDYGARFDAVHPPGSPDTVARAKVRDHHLDLRLTEEGGDAVDQGLDRVAQRLREVVVPLLDSLDDWGTTRGLLEHDKGMPTGTWSLAGAPGSAARSEVLGLLGLAHADPEVAVPALQHVVDVSRNWHQGEYADEASGQRLAFWEERLEQARRLGGQPR